MAPAGVGRYYGQDGALYARIHSHVRENRAAVSATGIHDRGFRACYMTDNASSLVNLSDGLMVQLTFDEGQLYRDRGEHLAHCTFSNAKRTSDFT